MSKWQAIESAPKVGRFLIWSAQGGVHEGCRYGTEVWTVETVTEMRINGSASRWRPTHWMPLPDPPVTS